MITPVSNCCRRRKTAAAFNGRLLFFGIFLCISALFDGRASAEQIKFRRISIEQGLSQSNVNAITQDHQGFMWFGTQDGLSRYDGYSFTTYRNKPDNPQSISDNYIWSIFCDSKGNLWVGTQGGGLNRYLPETDGFENFKNISGDNSSILSNNITNIIEDRDGQLWFACWSGGISRWIDAENGFRNYSPNPEDSTSLIDANVGILLEDAHQNLWAGTWNGLAMLPKSARESGKFVRFPYRSGKKNGLPDPKIWSLLENRNAPGDIWVGTFGNGLCIYHPETGEFLQPDLSGYETYTSYGAFINHLWQDAKGVIWVGSFDNGLSRYNPKSGRLSQYKFTPGDPGSINSNEVLSVFSDNTGVVWVGTGNGIAVLNPSLQMFNHFRFIPGSDNGLSHHKVRAVIEDSNGGIWVGTKGGGLDYLEPGDIRFRHFRNDPDKPGTIAEDRIYSLLEDNNGEIWIGTESRGLDKYDPKRKTFTHFENRENDPSSISGNSISALMMDRDGQLWVGTSGGGLNRYLQNKQGFQRYTSNSNHSDSLSGNWVWSIYEDRDGLLWIGTWGRGISRFDRKLNHFRQYLFDAGDSSGISNSTVTCTIEDLNGNLWIGTGRGGINLYDRENDRFYRITELNGLPNNSIYGILPDSSGCLWVSSNNGLARLSWLTGDVEQGFSAAPETVTENLRIKQFDINDGLQSNEFNQGAYFLGKSGTMYFGGINGLTTFHPAQVQESHHLPPVRLTKLKIFDKPVLFKQSLNSQQPLQLAYTENYLSFEYVAPDFSASDKKIYAYQLAGLEDGWIDAGKQRVVNYSHLKPGEYEFRVRVSGGDGVWNESGDVLKFVIAPPFWATWWFRSVSLIAIIAMIYGAIRYRFNRLLEIERLRSRLSADLHDELAGNLSSIAMFGVIIQNELNGNMLKNSGISNILERVISLSRDSVASIRDIIWAIDPKPETIESLLFRLHDYAANLCTAKQIDLIFKIPDSDKLPKTNLSPEQRQNLWLMLKETTQNAIKHAEATMLSINAAYKMGVLKIAISDNGKGFDTCAASSGKGLSTIQKRAKLLRGELKISSEAGKGTTVNFICKLKH